MHIAMRTGKIHAEDAAQVIDKIDTEFLEILRQMPGFVSYYMVQTKADELTSISIFESKEQAEGSSKTASEWVKENLGPYLTGPLEIVEGKVVVHGGN
jgi:quinol monooxygenase YgiN